MNPLDRTVNVATAHFHKFQYFMSVVPTIYSVGPTPSRRGSARSGADDYDVTEAGDATHRGTSRNTIFTNQYAVTEQSAEISEQNIPGIFFKYDIEPILLHVQETRDGLLSFTIKIVNILSGVVVAAHWGFTLSEWLKEVIGRKRRGGRSVDGMLGGKGALSGFGLHGEHDD